MGRNKSLITKKKSKFKKFQIFFRVYANFNDFEFAKSSAKLFEVGTLLNQGWAKVFYENHFLNYGK